VTKPWDIFNGGTPITLLSQSDCEELVGRIVSGEIHWTGRHALEDQVHLFYTLGAATYLDSRAAYGATAARSNPVLRGICPKLYQAVAEAIAEHTGHPAVLTDRLAIPGFHIFRGDNRAPPGLLYGGTIHMDKPHERHKLPGTIDGTLSLTLPLRIPASGAGMYFWKNVPNNMLSGPKAPHEMSPAQYAWFNKHKAFVNYEIGEMVLHDGLTVHQLANPGPTDQNDLRVSLQGHGVLCDGVWELFF